MPFQRPALKEALKNAFLAARENTSDFNTAIDALAEVMSDEIAAQVKSCIDDSAISNTVVHVLASPSGPVTGTITVTSTIVSTVE